MTAQYGVVSTWKHMAEEREQMARTMARIAVGLFIACNVLAVTSFSAQSRYSNLCEYVDEQAPQIARAAPQETSFARVLMTDYCG